MLACASMTGFFGGQGLPENKRVQWSPLPAAKNEVDARAGGGDAAIAAVRSAFSAQW
jgi:hypothetical protein